MKKRIVTLLMAMAVVSLCACGSNEATTDPTIEENTTNETDEFADAIANGDIETAVDMANGTTDDAVASTETSEGSEVYNDCCFIKDGKWTCYFLELPNDLVDWSTIVEDDEKNWGNVVSPTFNDYPDVWCNIKFVGTDFSEFDTDDETIFSGEINGLNTIIYRSDKSMNCYVGIGENKCVYIEDNPNSSLESITDEQLIDGLTNIISVFKIVEDAE